MFNATITFYSYEERQRSLDTVVNKHIDRTTYEEFVSQVFSPVMDAGPFCSRSAGISGGSRDGQPCASATSTLTAALLDHHTAGQHSHHHKVVRGQSKS